MHIHGGDIYSREVKYDFSANLNFLGMPQSVIDAACEGVRRSEHYPDVQCRRLRQAIAEKEQIPVDQILCGNGAADLIFALMLAEKPKRAVMCAPTFYEYQQALETVGCEIIRVVLAEDEEFAYSERILEALNEETDLLVLCNPNNPTGQILKHDLLDSILLRCRQYGIRVLLDECFVEFLDEPEKVEAISYVDTHPELFILRAFTKIYAMAGLRLGYAITSDADLRERIRRHCQPWNVSIPAQYAGVAALKETAYVEEFRRQLRIQRSWLKEHLTQLGVKIYGSHANYIFFHSEPGLTEQMLERGIAIRDCSNYIGLQNGYYRVAVRTGEENEALIQALREVLTGKTGENNG